MADRKRGHEEIGRKERIEDARIGREEREHDEIRRRALEKAEAHKPPTPEESKYDWKLVQETEGLDDEGAVREYAKEFSEDTSNANNKGRR